MMTSGLQVAILGKGGREHALAWKLAQSPFIACVHVIPGNAGMHGRQKIVCHPQLQATAELIDFCRSQEIAWVIPGSEEQLAQGIVDTLGAAGIRTFGPGKRSALLESSKIFSKLFMQRHEIPTAKAVVCNSVDEAIAVITHYHQQYGKVVVKASGLWAGKGVLVTDNLLQAFSFTHKIMRERPSEGVLVEAPLVGKELSLFILSDGRQWKTLGMACDYKRLFNDNQGPNTGGMGCFIPQQWPAQDLMQKIEQEIVVPTLQGLEQEGLQYCGILFIGLMIDENLNEVNVIEYNVRFGDPETQTILPAMEQDLAIYISSALGLLQFAPLNQLPELAPQRSSVHVVATSHGYAQGDMLVGLPIKMGKMPLGAELFYAAVAEDTTKNKQEQMLINDGGRVLGITAVADSLQLARNLAYRGIGEIDFDGMHWRTDIARN